MIITLSRFINEMALLTSPMDKYDKILKIKDEICYTIDYYYDHVEIEQVRFDERRQFT